jgi:hypothetical protein
MKHDNWLLEKPSLTNLAAEVSHLDHVGWHLGVQSSDKGREDRRKRPEQRDENLGQKVR